VWQVRQPVYTTSVARWRRYEPWLAELRQLPPPPTSTPRHRDLCLSPTLAIGSQRTGLNLKIYLLGGVSESFTASIGPAFP
jgi:hypothetical protein